MRSRSILTRAFHFSIMTFLALPISSALAVDPTPLIWDLKSDFKISPQQSNPNPDQYGNSAVWHYMIGPVTHIPAAYSYLPNFITSSLGVPGLQEWVGYAPSTGDFLPNVGINATGTTQHILNITWPAGVIRVHPLPFQNTIVGWKSPIDGVVDVNGNFIKIDPSCGNGVVWSVYAGTTLITSGFIPAGGGVGTFSDTALSVKKDDFIYFVLGAGAGDHNCDSTELDATITGIGSSTAPVDLSVSNIALFQPDGVNAPLDVSANQILATITPSTAIPAPKVPAARAEAQVTVNMTGVPSGATSTDVQLSLGSKIIADQLIDISQFQPGDNVVKISFSPPTDPSLLGVLPLTATVNTSKSVQETTYGNNSYSTNINTMVLCKVEDAGRVVPFHAQSELPWAPQPYGIPTISSGTFRQYGCSVTDLEMLFSSYGITNTPIGSPADPAPFGPHMSGLNGESLEPGMLNSALANYTTDFLDTGSVGFDANNDPIWPGAAEVARAGYQAQCQITGSCDPANAPNVVSFKGLNYGGFSEHEAIAAVQNEICSGNPVIMKFAKNGGGQHFMLATGVVLDAKKNQTLRLNNPGSNQPVQNSTGTGLGANAFYSNPALRSNYPSVIGYILYRPSSDPSMMFISAPMGVHFVVTDPLGRRAGFNPITATSYKEIPGATYGEQSIDTPADPGFAPSTLVDERYFISSQDVPPGSYNVQVFSLNGGSYYLDYRGFDSSGTTNDGHLKTGTLKPGESSTVSIQHSIAAAPRPNALLKLSSYSLERREARKLKDSQLEITGTIVPNLKSPLSLTTSVEISIGGINGYKLYLPAYEFKVKKDHGRTLYQYRDRKVEISLDASGRFELEIKQADLSGVDAALLGAVSVSIDSIIGSAKVRLTCNEDDCSFRNRTRQVRDNHDHDEKGDR